jgi:phage terminase small subunit
MLTAKQEKFVQCIIEGMSQADAYRSAYDTSRMRDKTVHEKASRMAADDKIRARIEELREQVMTPSIMSAQERLELLTRMAKGEEPERVVQFIEGQRFEFEVPASLKLRREAIDTMNKMTGEYVTKVEGSVSVTKLEDLI